MGNQLTSLAGKLSLCSEEQIASKGSTPKSDHILTLGRIYLGMPKQTLTKAILNNGIELLLVT